MCWTCLEIPRGQAVSDRSRKDLRHLAGLTSVQNWEKTNARFCSPFQHRHSHPSPVTLPTTLSSVWGALPQPLPVDSALGSEVPTPVWQVWTRGTGPTPHTRPQLQAAGRASPPP